LAQERRIVLILDVWHPDLTANEIWALERLMKLSTVARRKANAARRRRAMSE
jgi:hypothetical protein